MRNFTPSFPWFPHVDMYLPRNYLYEHVISCLPDVSGTVLDVGCGTMPYKNLIEQKSSAARYLGMDLEQSDIYSHIKPDIYWDGYAIPLEDSYVDTVMITEVLEHCPYPEKVLAEVARVLKPGGKVIFSVPFLWNLHESPWDFYRYTPFAIQTLFKNAGLSLPRLETYGSPDLSFLHFYFIWLKRSKLPKIIRFAIYLLTLPFILLFLSFRSKKNNTDFKNGNIFIGIVGLAQK